MGLEARNTAGWGSPQLANKKTACFVAMASFADFDLVLCSWLALDGLPWASLKFTDGAVVIGSAYRTTVVLVVVTNFEFVSRFRRFKQTF